MKPFFSLVLVLFLSTSTFSQDAITHNRSRNNMLELLSKKKNNNSNLEVNNKHYLNKLFLPGEVFYENKKTKGDYSLRYNAYKDLIELANNKESDFVLRNPKISCKINGKKYVYRNFRKKGEIRQGYLKVIYKNEDITLYERESIIFREAKIAKTSQTPSIPAKYLKYKKFYISDNNSVANEVSQKRRTFLKSFDKNNRNNIKSFIKKKKIDLEKGTDMVKVYKYIKTLS